MPWPQAEHSNPASEHVEPAHWPKPQLSLDGPGPARSGSSGLSSVPAGVARRRFSIGLNIPTVKAGAARGDASAPIQQRGGRQGMVAEDGPLSDVGMV